MRKVTIVSPASLSTPHRSCGQMLAAGDLYRPIEHIDVDNLASLQQAFQAFSAVLSSRNKLSLSDARQTKRKKGGTVIRSRLDERPSSTVVALSAYAACDVFGDLYRSAGSPKTLRTTHKLALELFESFDANVFVL